jgi:tRNA-specific 2-thiouridylase
VTAGAGEIVDESGVTRGQHDGFWRYTPGQRRGLGVAGASGTALYALRAEPRSNTVVVGPRESLARTRVTAAGRLYVTLRRAEAKLRYRSPAIAADVEPTADGFQLVLEQPAYGVAPGQLAVLYDDDAIVGAGVITETGR